MSSNLYANISICPNFICSSDYLSVRLSVCTSVPTYVAALSVTSLSVCILLPKSYINLLI
jgi:hypothetical protein